MTASSGDRRARRKARREEARRAEASRPNRNRWLIPGFLAAIIVAAAAIAVLLPGVGRQGTGGSSTLPPSAAASGGSVGTAGVPAITGGSLPDFQNPKGDAAVGLPAPQVAGTDFTGKPVAIKKDGRPKVILFIAHWCPHCQREVPLLQAWVSAGGIAAGLDVISVATSIDPTRPNYPPDAWLAGEGWTVPTIADPTNTVASAYGLTAFPYWVFIAPDGTVKARAVGELPIADLQTIISGLKGG